MDGLSIATGRRKGFDVIVVGDEIDELTAPKLEEPSTAAAELALRSLLT